MAGWRTRLSALLVLTACGRPEPPKVVAVAPPAAAPVRAPQRAAQTPLPLPHNLVLAGRWKNPLQSLKQLESWSRGDLGLELWLRARIGQPSRPIDLTAPIEFFAVWDHEQDRGQLRWGLSLGLEAGAPLASSAPRDVPSPLGLACAETPALGAAPLRLVCARSDAELLELLPIATRAVPLSALGPGELSIGVHAEPLRGVAEETLEQSVTGWLRDAFGVSKVNERFDAGLSLFALDLAHELHQLGDDLDGASLDLSLRPAEQALEVSLLAPALHESSLLGQVLIGSGTVGLAPSDFWAEQITSVDAGYLWSFESSPFARFRQPLGVLVGELLGFRGLPRRLQRQGRDLLETLPLPRGPVVYASGRLPEAARLGGNAPAWLAQLGWKLYQFAGNFAEYQGYADAFASAVNDPILGPQCARLVRTVSGSKWAPQHVRRRRPIGAARLPRESFTLEISFALPRSEAASSASVAADSAEGAHHSRSSEREKLPPTLFGLFVPEPGGVKIAWGTDEKFLTALALEPTRAQAQATLAGRAGLGSLHEHRTLAGGFSSLAALPNLRGAGWRSAETDVAEPASADVAASSSPLPVPSLADTPHRGLSPIVYRVARLGNDAALVLTAQLGRDTLEDLLFLISAQPVPPP
jgi:hypothetical protein